MRDLGGRNGENDGWIFYNLAAISKKDFIVME